MIIAEDASPQGIAIWIGTIATAALTAYALARRTRRAENVADAESQRKQDEDNQISWRKQREEDRKVDAEYRAKLATEVAEMRCRYNDLEREHLECREEHAIARGEINALKRDNEALREQISELRGRLLKAGV